MNLTSMDVSRIKQERGVIRHITWRSRRAAFAALTRALTSGGRGCGNAWSLHDMTGQMGGRHRVGRKFRFLRKENFFGREKKII